MNLQIVTSLLLVWIQVVVIVSSFPMDEIISDAAEDEHQTAFSQGTDEKPTIKVEMDMVFTPEQWADIQKAYMEQVPEANFMSQVQRNKEVKVHLLDPEFKFLQVKESLTHMRRNLSSLLNSDVMLGDDPKMPYESVASTDGSGHMIYRREVVKDDEDLVAYGFGSGSGSGDDSPDVDGWAGGSGHRTTTPFLLLCLCFLCHRLLDSFK